MVETYLDDVGKYGCTAGNSGGFQREEVYLHVASELLINSPHHSSRFGGINKSDVHFLIDDWCVAEVAFICRTLRRTRVKG